MSVFSTNQARNLYVATAYKTPSVIASDAAGSIAVKTNKAKDHLSFEYKGVGGLTRSDLIDIKNIMYAKATKADDMAKELKAVTVTLDPKVNGGAPIAGQDYILRINFDDIAADNTYTKYGMVHAYAGMTASDFYKTLALSLVKNFSREATELVKFTLTNAEDAAVPVNATTTADSLTGEYKALVIDEVEQPWALGINPYAPVYFEAFATTITVEGDEVVWGKVEDKESEGKVHNGKQIADLEYFCMGERGDVYRNAGWPNTIVTKYLVDPSKPYHTLDIHYAYVGSNEAVQKSEKDITIVCADMAELNKIITAVNSATGLNISSLA